MVPLHTLTTVTLLNEPLLALRENNPEGFKHLLNLGLQELGLELCSQSQELRSQQSVLITGEQGGGFTGHFSG